MKSMIYQYLLKNKYILALSVLLIIFIWEYLQDLHNTKDIFTISSTISIIGLLFGALKHKLDSSKYNLDLFDRRYEIFVTLIDIYQIWMRGDIYNNDNVLIKLQSILNKSYCLFGNETYKFISKFKEAIVYFRYIKEKPKEKTEIKKWNQHHDFLVNLSNNENFIGNFHELKIDSY